MKKSYRQTNRLTKISKLLLALGVMTMSLNLAAQIPTENLKLHLKADFGTSTTTEGAQVTSWADASGNGNSPVQMSGPITYEKYVAYGKPAIKLKGTHQIKLPTASQLGIANSTFEIFIVAGVTNSTTNYILGGSDQGDFDFTIVTDSYTSFYSGSNSLQSNGNYYNNGLHILNGAVTDTSMTYSVDGGTPLINNSSNKSYSTGNLRLGRRGDGSYNMEGYIAEVIIYNRSLSVEEKDQVQTYLNEKYGFGQTPLPGVSVTAATNITGSSVTLNGTVSTNGTTENYIETSFRFAYGADPNNLTDTTDIAYAGDGNTASTYNVSESLTGLSTGTYYYRLLATENGNTNRSALSSFTLNNVTTDQISFWLRADYGIQYAFEGYSAISTWVESSSNNISFPRSGSYPEFTGDGLNNKPGVSVSGNSYFFKDMTTLGLLNTDFDIFFVVKSSSSSSQVLINDNNNPSSTRVFLNNGSGISVVKNGVDLMSYGESNSLTNGQPILVNVKISSTGGKIFVNGTEVASTESDGRFVGSNYIYLLANSSALASKFNGVVSEIIAYKKNLTDTERDDVETYLMSKYNFVTPTVPASNLIFSSVTPSAIELSVTPGNGTKRMFVSKTGGPITFVPVDNTTYSYGQELEDSSIVSEIGSYSSTTRYNPGINTNVYFKVFEFNGANGSEKYLTINPASGSVSTPFEKPYISFNDIDLNDVHSLKLFFEIGANGDSTYYRIVYGTNSENLTDTTEVDTTYNNYNDSSIEFEKIIGGLEQGNDYYFKIIAENRGGVSEETYNFTLNNIPTGYIESVSKLKGDSVTVVGYVNAKGIQTNARYNYGTNPEELNTQTPLTDIGSNDGNTTFEVTLHGISQGQAYFISLAATNEAGELITENFEFFADSTIPPAALVRHLTADYGIEANDGEPVVYWTSILGTESSDAWQEYESETPTYAANAINSKPAVHFDGSDYLVSPPPTQISEIGYSMFFVVKSGSSSSQTLYYSDAGYVLLNIFDAGLVYYTGYGGIGTGISGEFTDGAAHIFQITISETGSQLWIDGVLKESAEDDLRYGGEIYTNGYIGASEGGYFEGDFAEMMIWSGDLKQSQADSLTLYFADKYGISVPTVPVELSSLEITGTNLTWTTMTESNNAGWEVEVSSQLSAAGNQQEKSNGSSVIMSEVEGFTKIGFIPGKGTTTEKQTYSFSLASLKTSARIRLKQIDFDGKFSYSQIIEFNANEIPGEYSLSQNYPNPFNPVTVINYKLPAAGQVRLVVFDLLGREVATLVNEKKEAGSYTAAVNGANLTSGVYFYKLTAGNFSETKKMTLIK